MIAKRFPLQDGDKIIVRGHEETVMGEIKVPHKEPVCWTLRGNWYRRSDGEEMTGSSGEVTTLKEFWEMRKKGLFK